MQRKFRFSSEGGLRMGMVVRRVSLSSSKLLVMLRAWCLRHGRAGTDAERRSLDAFRRLRCELSAITNARTAHCTRPRLSTNLNLLSTTVPSARRAFELCALPALAYKYEARWRGPAPDHDASRIHIDINWRCSRCPPDRFYCLSISYSQLAKAA